MPLTCKLRGVWRRLRRRWLIIRATPFSSLLRRHIWWPLRGFWWHYSRVIVLGAVALGALCVYSLIVYLTREPDQFGLWLNTMVSTVASVLLAVVAGYVLFMWQARYTARNKKQDTTNLLRHELIGILTDLREDIDPDRNRRFPPKPKESEIHPSALDPASHETDFLYRYLDPRLIERAYLDGDFKLYLTVDLNRLSKLLHQYNRQVSHLRSLSVAYDGSETSGKRYRRQAIVVFRQERSLAKNARIVLNRLKDEEIK